MEILDHGRGGELIAKVLPSFFWRLFFPPLPSCTPHPKGTRTRALTLLDVLGPIGISIAGRLWSWGSFVCWFFLLNPSTTTPNPNRGFKTGRHN